MGIGLDHNSNYASHMAKITGMHHYTQLFYGYGSLTNCLAGLKLTYSIQRPDFRSSDS
jgi:hypothetical protein